MNEHLAKTWFVRGQYLYQADFHAMARECALTALRHAEGLSIKDVAAIVQSSIGFSYIQVCRLQEDRDFIKIFNTVGKVRKKEIDPSALEAEFQIGLPHPPHLISFSEFLPFCRNVHDRVGDVRPDDTSLSHYEHPADKFLVDPNNSIRAAFGLCLQCYERYVCAIPRSPRLKGKLPYREMNMQSAMELCTVIDVLEGAL